MTLKSGLKGLLGVLVAAIVIYPLAFFVGVRDHLWPVSIATSVGMTCAWVVEFGRARGFRFGLGFFVWFVGWGYAMRAYPSHANLVLLLSVGVVGLVLIGIAIARRRRTLAPGER